MENSTTSTPAGQHFRFLDLPSEIRNQISEAYFAPNRNSRAVPPALTQVNRQIRSETTAMAYHDAHFVNTSIALTPSLPPVLSKLPSHTAALLHSGHIDIIYPSLTGGPRRPDLRMGIEWDSAGNIGMACSVLVWNANPLATAILKYRAFKRIRMYRTLLRDKFPGRESPVPGMDSFILINELRPLRHAVPGAVFLVMDGSRWVPTRIIRATPSQDEDWERVVGCVLGEAIDAMLYAKPYVLPVYRRIAAFRDRIEQFQDDLIRAAAHRFGIPELFIRALLHFGVIFLVVYDLIGFERLYSALIAVMRWISWLRAFL